MKRLLQASMALLASSFSRGDHKVAPKREERALAVKRQRPPRARRRGWGPHKHEGERARRRRQVERGVLKSPSMAWRRKTAADYLESLPWGERRRLTTSTLRREIDEALRLEDPSAELPEGAIP